MQSCNEMKTKFFHQWQVETAPGGSHTEQGQTLNPRPVEGGGKFYPPPEFSQ